MRWMWAFAMCVMATMRAAGLPCWSDAEAGPPLPSLRGSPESKEWQIEVAKKEGLERILNDARLKRMVRDGTLVKLPTNRNLKIDFRIPPAFRVCLPRVKLFLLDLASAPKLTGRIKVNSAVRTEIYQRQLRKRNPNAVSNSSHTYGCTVDIAKLGHTEAELDLLRTHLLALETAGLIEATEEHTQSVFHVMVFAGYVEKRCVPTHQPSAAKPVAPLHKKR